MRLGWVSLSVNGVGEKGESLRKRKYRCHIPWLRTCLLSALPKPHRILNLMFDRTDDHLRQIISDCQHKRQEGCLNERVIFYAQG